MRFFGSPSFLVLCLLLCSSLTLHGRSRRGRNAPEKPAESAQDTPAVFPAEETPRIVITDLPRTPELIVGRGEAGADQLVSFLLSVNAGADRRFLEELAGLYIAEAAAEGINHDIAFAQMCLETGFLRFGGLVRAEMNNFCGLGSIGPGEPGERFPSAEIGVRAHIQHLKAYATNTPLAGDLVDPRYRFVRRGSAPAVRDLAGSWAADLKYAEKIEAILARLRGFGNGYHAGSP